METHANAIQTILHNNYINVFGGKTTRYMIEGAPYPMANILLIFSLCVLAYVLLTKVELHPINAGIIIFSEGVLYYAFAMGMFANDYWWFWKSTLATILPDALYDKFYDQLQVVLPGPGESYVVPIVAPLAGLMLTYASNIIFQFLH